MFVKFSDNLREIRTKCKISQGFIAKEIGVSTRMYQKYESGEVLPNILVANKMAKVLRVPTESLIGGYRPRKGGNVEVIEMAKKTKKYFEEGKCDEEVMAKAVKIIVRAYCEKTGAKSIKI